MINLKQKWVKELGVSICVIALLNTVTWVQAATSGQLRISGQVAAVWKAGIMHYDANGRPRVEVRSNTRLTTHIQCVDSRSKDVTQSVLSGRFSEQIPARSNKAAMALSCVVTQP